MENQKASAINLRMQMESVNHVEAPLNGSYTRTSKSKARMNFERVTS